MTLLLPLGETEFPTPRLEFIRCEKLKEHERADTALDQLLNKIRSDGFLRRPIAVDLNTNIILDGHCRFNCLKLLGCKMIPAYLFDYGISDIVVLSHRDGENITKEDIIRAGLTGNRLPSKSSKHMIRLKSGGLVHISQFGKDIDVPLGRLKTEC